MGNTLYRLYDDRNRLLYIGITLSPPERFRHHAADKSWWNSVATIKLQNYADRPTLVRAERYAIAIEHPRYNIVHDELRSLGLSLSHFESSCPDCDAMLQSWYPDREPIRSFQPPETWEITTDYDVKYFAAKYHCWFHEQHRWTENFELP